jgi:hypothetical protein
MAQPIKRQESGVFYFRRRVPEALQPFLGREYKRTLNTRDPVEAKRLHALEWTNCEAVFARARAQANGTTQLTGRDAQVLAGRWFQAELAKVDASGRYENWLARAF